MLLTRPVCLVCFGEGRPFLPELAERLAASDVEVYRFDLERGRVYRGTALTERRPLGGRHRTAVATLWRHRQLLRRSIVHFHFLHPVYAFAMAFVPRRRTIVQFWGSDIYRAGGLRHRLQRHLTHRAAVVTCTSERTRQEIIRRYGRPDVRKWHFGLRSLDDLAARLNGGARVRQDVIAIGYNGFREQHHLRIIESCAGPLRALAQRYEIVIPFTYGGSDDYRAEVEGALRQNSIRATLLTDFLRHEDLLTLRLRTALMLHLPVSDAFSASMQEVLAVGGEVLTGDWLAYPELESAGLPLRHVSWAALPEVLAKAASRLLGSDACEPGDQTRTTGEGFGTARLFPALLAVSSWEACLPKYVEGYQQLGR